MLERNFNNKFLYYQNYNMMKKEEKAKLKKKPANKGLIKKAFITDIDSEKKVLKCKGGPTLMKFFKKTKEVVPYVPKRTLIINTQRQQKRKEYKV